MNASKNMQQQINDTHQILEELIQRVDNISYVLLVHSQALDAIATKAGLKIQIVEGNQTGTLQ